MPLTRQSKWELRLGSARPRRPNRTVRIGAFSAELEDADLLYVRLDGTEVVRRISVRVRDTVWGTTPGEVEPPGLSGGREAVVQLDLRHQDQNIDFAWRCKIAPDGPRAFVYEMDGRALSDFLYNRLGICVLHPLEHFAGRRYRAWTSEGPVAAGFLPETVGPQMITDGRVFPLFPSFNRLEIDATPGLVVSFEFEGDLFEMEDQRNWSDGSFKTYSNPLSLPLPFEAKKGQRLYQRVRVEAREKKSSAPRSRTRQATGSTAELSLAAGPSGGSVPSIGLCLDSDGHIPDERETSLLRELAPSYLRADIAVGGARARQQLKASVRVAEAIGAPLELALTFHGDRRACLDALARLNSELRQADCLRLLVFKSGALVTPRDCLELVRASRPQSLARAAVVGGTNFNFAELNRDRPDPAAVDGVVYSVTPQIHDTDEAALVQSLEGQRDTVVAARSFSGHLPVHIGAVTLKPRLNQAAAALGTGADELTGETDERQKSLFAAAWTAMSVKYLTEAGAASLTFFELTGPGGTLARTSEEGETGGTLGLFPVYHVLRHLNAWRGAEVVPCHSNRALAVEAFAARRGGRLEVIVANLTLHAQTALVRGLPSSAAELCVLDEETVVLAGNDPGGFERTGHPATVGGGCLTLGLQPLAVVRVTTRAA